MTTLVTSGQMQRSLASECYTAPGFYARERERIFFREWLCVLREGELRSGEVRVVEILGESVLVARAKDGALHAHYNVCRHRGARLCAPAEDGRAASGVTPGGALRCGYHSWTYGLDGRLLSAPHLGDGLDASAFALHPVGVATWGGFVFLHATPKESGPLEHQLGPVPERLRRYPLERLRVARRIEYVVAANWKVVAENYNECYHCGPVHPELCDVVPAFRRAGGSGLDWDRGIPHRDGAWTFTRTGTTTRAAFPGLSQDERSLHKGELVYPNLFLSLSADHVAAFRLFPEAPERTRIVCEFLFHPDEVARPDFDPTDAVEFWDLINRQDWAICEDVQRGMRSRVHRHGYMAPMEDLSLDIRRYVTERVGEHE